MAKGSPRTLAHMAPASTTVQGPVKKAAAVTNVASFTAPASGSVAVTSNAATDLDTVSAQVAALTTKVNALLAAMRTAGLLS